MWHCFQSAKSQTMLFSHSVVTHNFSQMLYWTTGCWPSTVICEHCKFLQVLHFFCTLGFFCLLSSWYKNMYAWLETEHSAVRQHQERVREAKLQNEFFIPTNWSLHFKICIRWFHMEKAKGISSISSIFARSVNRSLNWWIANL